MKIVSPPDTETVFPWHLAKDVFDLLAQKDIKTVRYCDLNYKNSLCGSKLRYLDEYIEFRHGTKGLIPLVVGGLSYTAIRFLSSRSPVIKRIMSRLSRKAQKPTVIIQHDADLLPHKTLLMMQLEMKYNIRSSSYFFVKHAQGFEYELDFKKLKEFEEEGFEIGYHQNAYELSGYNQEKAYTIIKKDLESLNRHFDIRSFVPHGGIPSKTGLNNEKLLHKGELRDLLWAYNGNCILKEYTWSDGNILKRCPVDPRKFVQDLLNGTRAMMLMHPQYYGSMVREDWTELPLSEEEWWRKLWNL